MTLIEQIRADQIAARKQRLTEKAGQLTTLLAEAERVGLDDGKRESTDAEVIAVVKKFIKNLEDTMGVLADGDSSVRVKLEEERDLYNEYLPAQLDEAQLKAVIDDIIGDQEKSMKLMGSTMKTLKERHGGEFDGKLASTLVKQALAA